MDEDMTPPDVAATVPLSLYSRALDEIYELRRALAYEAGVVDAHTGYKTFPKTRRAIAEKQAERMRAAARGEVGRAYAGTSSLSLRHGLREAGAGETLTRTRWEAERVHRPNCRA